MTQVNSRYRGSREYLLTYSELINAARYRGTLTYKDIAAILGIHTPGNHMSRETGWILGEISEDESNQRRPMLSAIVLTSNGKPGRGFYDLARQLGKLQHDSVEAEEAFWKSEREHVYRTWQR